MYALIIHGRNSESCGVEHSQQCGSARQTFEGRDMNLRHASRLSRAFATQVEALKRYRTGGQQKVTVEHVTVNQGGQAIVGNVTQAWHTT